MKSSLLFLGSGASLGVPMIGCDCAVCKSNTPFNRRTRSSAYLKIGDRRLVIDVGPEFREQALTHHIKCVDGIILTHAHQDHVAGLDDLRALFFKKKAPIPLIMSKETRKDVEERFYYLFKRDSKSEIGPRVEAVELPCEAGGEKFSDVCFRYFTYEQQGMKVTGLRFGDLAYVTDIRDYDESVFEELEGVKTLVLSALRHSKSEMHFTVDEACQFAEKVGAKSTYLTHISHDMDHFETATKLPPGVHMSYDGLEIPFTGY
ncbi:MAG: MBL fold metallo-hydrolase [Chlamydiia bacterium]|nr:MBL fold metallo-hydrolase [Chlamydiia bacterium]